MMDAIVALLPPEARLRRQPTPEELALAYPPGPRRGGDTDVELQRRPGED